MKKVSVKLNYTELYTLTGLLKVATDRMDTYADNLLLEAVWKELFTVLAAKTLEQYEGKKKVSFTKARAIALQIFCLHYTEVYHQLGGSAYVLAMLIDIEYELKKQLV